MQCAEVKHIIDQVFDRELPSEALNDLSAHIDNCPECMDHLGECRKIHDAVNLFKTEDLNESFYVKLGDRIENQSIKLTLWESIILNSKVRVLAAVAAVIFVAAISGIALYHHSMSSSQSFSDKKLEAMMKKLPEGAVLMRTSSGEEVIFLDPALEADHTYDDLMRELDQTLNKDSSLSSDDLTFASTNVNK